MDEVAGSNEPDIRAMLDKVIRRQDRADARIWRQPDQLLNVLESVGTTGMGVALSLIVDGCVLTGVCGPSDALAFRVGQAARTAMDAMGIEESTADRLQEMLSSAEDTLKERAEEFRSVVEKYDENATIDDLDAADLAKYFLAYADRTFIDLRNVTFSPAGSNETIAVSAMRVRIDSISAWWPTEAQEDVVVNYLPSPSE